MSTNNLAEVIKQWRWATKLTLRDAAKLIGMNHSTLLRLEHGEQLDSANMAKVIRWLLEGF